MRAKFHSKRMRMDVFPVVVSSAVVVEAVEEII
jgi:hypothetical protein